MWAAPCVGLRVGCGESFWGRYSLVSPSVHPPRSVTELRDFGDGGIGPLGQLSFHNPRPCPPVRATFSMYCHTLLCGSKVELTG